MLRFIALFILVTGSSSVFCQPQSKASLLVNRMWRIEYDMMVGIGLHDSVSKNTTITFFENHTWRSSLPIHGCTIGKWVMKDDETLSMSFSDQAMEYTVVKLDHDKLKYQRGNFVSRYTTVWSAHSN